MVESVVQELGLKQHPIDLPDATLFGRPFYFVEQCTSTNDVMQKLGESGASEGTVVLAEKQIMGRGRQKSSWFSHPDIIEFSMLLRPQQNSGELPFLNVLVSYAVLKTLFALCQLPAMLKWPNDIIVRGRKLCGVLSEMRSHGEAPPFVVVGCGCNLNVALDVFPSDLRSLATSVIAETGRELDQGQFFSSFFGHLSDLYRAYAGDNRATIN